jgi:hypothetical protein
LKLQVELDESNYKYAVELQKDPNVLLRMRENIKKEKEELQVLTGQKEEDYRNIKSSRLPESL